MAPITDSDLYARGAATLLASWQEYAGGSSGAALLHLNGVAAAVVPDDPERAVYNNALLDRDLGAAERATAVEAMEAAYSSAGIERYAAWVHESDEGIRGELIAFHILVARLGVENVATAMAFDHNGDCGVFNVGPSRRHAAAGSAPRSRRATCTTRQRAAARQRAFSRRRWPSASTRRSVSATSAGSSSTCPKRRRTVLAVGVWVAHTEPWPSIRSGPHCRGRASVFAGLPPTLTPDEQRKRRS
jgi:hypothetical protein